MPCAEETTSSLDTIGLLISNDEIKRPMQMELAEVALDHDLPNTDHAEHHDVRRLKQERALGLTGDRGCSPTR